MTFLCPSLALANPGFSRWFGESKAVDATGKPLLLFHGTETPFTTFDPNAISKRSTRPAFWLTSYKACGYYGPHRLPFYAKLERLFVAPDGWMSKWVHHCLHENLQAELSDQPPVWDGVVYPDVVDGDTPADVYAVFSPESLRSVRTFPSSGSDS